MKLALVKDDESVNPNEDPKADKSRMTFLEHLDELRHRLVRIAVYVGIGFLVCFGFRRPLFDFISAPIRPFLTDEKLSYMGIPDAIVLDVKICIIAGIFLTSPLILHEIWKFIAPGLYKHEKRYVVPFLISSVLLFIGGGAFCYYLILPQAFNIMLNWNPDLTPVITTSKYLSFTNMMILSFAFMFEMPVIVAFLSMFRLVTAKFMIKNFKYALLIIVIVAAVVSPTVDGIAMLFWVFPLMLLYVVSIGVAALFNRRQES